MHKQTTDNGHALGYQIPELVISRNMLRANKLLPPYQYIRRFGMLIQLTKTSYIMEES